MPQHPDDDYARRNRQRSEGFEPLQRQQQADAPGRAQPGSGADSDPPGRYGHGAGGSDFSGRREALWPDARDSDPQLTADWRREEERFEHRERARPAGGADDAFLPEHWAAPEVARADADRWETRAGDTGRRFDAERGRAQFAMDADYARWREAHMRQLDEDYAAYRRERYERFVQDFDQWRAARAAGRPVHGTTAASAGTGRHDAAPGSAPTGSSPGGRQHG